MRKIIISILLTSCISTFAFASNPDWLYPNIDGPSSLLLTTNQPFSHTFIIDGLPSTAQNNCLFINFFYGVTVVHVSALTFTSIGGHNITCSVSGHHATCNGVAPATGTYDSTVGTTVAFNDTPFSATKPHFKFIVQ